MNFKMSMRSYQEKDLKPRAKIQAQNPEQLVSPMPKEHESKEAGGQRIWWKYQTIKH